MRQPPQRFDLIVFDKFTYQGKARQRPYKIGTAVAAKGSYTLFIPTGLAITGRVVMVPEKAELTEIDLLAIYESAADEHGV